MKVHIIFKISPLKVVNITTYLKLACTYTKYLQPARVTQLITKNSTFIFRNLYL